MHRLAPLDFDYGFRTTNKPDLIQLNMLALPAAAGPPLVCSPQTASCSIERGILLAVTPFPDSGTGLYAWPSRAAPQEQPELRKTHAESPCRYLSEPGEASALR